MSERRHPIVGTVPDGTVLTTPPGDEPVDKAVAEVRRVIRALLGTDRENANLVRVAEELGSIADHLEEHTPAEAEQLINMWRGEGVTSHEPVTGRENAIAPPLVIRGYDDGWVRAVVTLTMPYQGPPGCVHGGISALLLDQVLGVANAWAGKDGMTAQLNVRYHQPTPLFQELTISGRQTGVDGRKIHTVGEIRNASGEVCVSVEGLFVDAKVPRPR